MLKLGGAGKCCLSSLPRGNLVALIKVHILKKNSKVFQELKEIDSIQYKVRVILWLKMMK